MDGQAADGSGLHLRGVAFSYGSGAATVPVLERIDLDAAENEFVAVLGPSGCGKSTLFHIIAGLLAPRAGRVTLDGADITGSTGHIAYMMQKDLLLQWRTVAENVILGAEIAGRDKRRAAEEARQLMRRFGLAGFEDYYPRALSGGMRQRAAMLRTVLCHKSVMLLDEPFASLDALTRADMQEWLLDIWQEFRRTVILITHDPEEAIFLSDRVYVLSPRPARLARMFAVPFERPRRQSDVAQPAFAQLKGAILQEVRSATHGAGTAPLPAARD